MNVQYKDNEEPLSNFFTDYCEQVDLTIEELFSKSRKREIVDKRMVLAYLLRTSLGMTYHDIGEALKKNHATIIYAIKNLENFITVYPHIKRLYDIGEGCMLKHKENLVEFYKIPIRSEIERQRKLVEILLDNNEKLQTKIKKLKEELYEYKS
tara:strand:- start:377 stop:835 length:459 start_codon:yes stop_codon:yes gene_type:complete